LAGVAAVRLFVERAQATQSDFALTEDNAAAVTAICRRLDGLPLAIELAASWIKLLPPATLLARLERRLPLLAGGARDAPARQRTMRDAVAWSHDLLGAEEQVLFRRLAVFVGGFTLEAAEWVVGVGSWVLGVGVMTAGSTGAVSSSSTHHPPPNTLDLVASLLDHSLLQRGDGAGAEPRYRMLETIREYGLERLTASGEECAVRDAHAAWFVALGETAEEGLQGAAQVAWLERLERDHDNLRAALAWLPERGEIEAALRLAGSLWLFRWLRGYHAEARDQYEELLARPGAAGRTVARATALNGLGVIALSQGDTERAIAAHVEALAIGRECGEPRAEAFSLACLSAAVLSRSDLERGHALAAQSLAVCQRIDDRWGAHLAVGLLASVALNRNDREGAEALFRESLALERALGVRWGTALTLDSLGWLTLDRGDPGQARSLFEEALAMMDELGDRRDRIDALAGLGRAVEAQGDLASAIVLYEESLTLARETGDRRGLAQAHFWLGHGRWLQGETGEALRQIGNALRLYQAIGNLVHTAASIEAVAVLSVARGETALAARLLGSAAGLLDRTGAPIPRIDRFDADASERVLAAMEPASFAAAWQGGYALTTEEAVAAALAAAEDRP
jgi:predicted ATPase